MAGPNIDDGAVAIDKGDIVAVGKAFDIARRFAGREIINARGNAVLPGFVNAHIVPAEAKNVDREFVRWGTRLAAAEMIASGTTTIDPDAGASG